MKDTGLCERCKETAALPEDYLCLDCAREVETILAEMIAQRRKPPVKEKA